MHPQIIKDALGNCTICGMSLIKKKNEGAAIKNDTLMILLKPTNEYVISTVNTSSKVKVLAEAIEKWKGDRTDDHILIIGFKT